MPSEQGIRRELEAVRKGRGIQEPQLRDRMGPELRRRCGVRPDTSHGDARRVLAAVLTTASTALPAQLGFAARVMFAIDEAHLHRFLRQRYEVLAARWNCDFRTVQRRCDEALALVADHLHDEAPADVTFVPAAAATAGPAEPADAAAADSWYLERFSSVLLLNRERPESIDEQTVVATADGLARLGLRYGLPRHPRENRPQLTADMEVLFGGRFDAVQYLGDTMLVRYLTLPRPLRLGERHTYARTVRIPTDQLMVPRYVHVARRRCDVFDLRVKFDPAALPKVVWVVSRAPELLFSNQRPGRERIEPDAVGEVHVRFTDLRIGLGYGVAWLPAKGDHE